MDLRGFFAFFGINLFDFLPVSAYNETDNIVMAENITLSRFLHVFCVAFSSAGEKAYGVL